MKIFPLMQNCYPGHRFQYALGMGYHQGFHYYVGWYSHLWWPRSYQWINVERKKWLQKGKEMLDKQVFEEKDIQLREEWFRSETKRLINNEGVSSLNGVLIDWVDRQYRLIVATEDEV